MNAAIWMPAGAALGWKIVVPILLAAAAAPGDFSTAALFFAAVVATTFLFFGDVVYNRWGVGIPGLAAERGSALREVAYVDDASKS